MKYINQLEHRHVPYRTHVKDPNVSEEDKMRNVARAGCGLCCTCMMIDILTNQSLDIEECVKISEECVANHSAGTDMEVLGPVIAEKFGIEYAATNSVDEAIRHIQNGGQVIARVGVPKGAPIGLFTKGEHYISLISTDGKEFCILDPSYTPEKHAIPERAGKVNIEHAPFLYCDVNAVDSEAVTNRPAYYLFSRKRG